MTYFGFDAAGRMTHVVCPGIGTAYYEFDPVGNLVRKSVVTPEGPGPHTYFEYDPANRYASILNCHADGSPACYFEYQWDAASRISLIRRENRDTIYYGYDPGDRLTSEEWRASGGGVIYAFQWDYDLVGNRVYESAAGVGDWLVFRRWKTCLSPSPLACTASMTARGQAPAPAETYYEHDAANELSDIDLIVIAPEFDGNRNRQLIRRLWIARGQADSRIEPIPCGEREWETEGGRPILDIARSEGVEINMMSPE